MSTQRHATEQTNNRQRLRRPQAAAYLGIATKTLDKWALLGKGPKFKRVSPRLVVYDPDDLEAFLAACPTGGGLRSAL